MAINFKISKHNYRIEATPEDEAAVFILTNKLGTNSRLWSITNGEGMNFKIVSLVGTYTKELEPLKSKRYTIKNISTCGTKTIYVPVDDINNLSFIDQAAVKYAIELLSDFSNKRQKN